MAVWYRIVWIKEAAMKFSSIRYLLSEGFRNIWQNRFMAVASIGVLVSCLLLTGGSYLTYVNINGAFQWAYSQNVVVVFADLDCDVPQIEAIQNSLKSIDNISDVTYISKDEALEKYADDIPEATFNDLQGSNNPMQDSFVVKFKDLSQFDDTLTQISQIENVDDISSNRDIATTLTKVRQVVLSIGFAIVLLLLLVSLFIIANTIKLTVYNRRLEINIMKAVGATNNFIRIPFLIEGMVLGLISSLFSFVLIQIGYNYLASKFTFSSMLGLVGFSTVWPVLLIGFLFIGLITGMVGSGISVTKYLRAEGGSLND
jgi:cell division transport system permease protein